MMKDCGIDKVRSGGRRGRDGEIHDEVTTQCWTGSEGGGSGTGVRGEARGDVGMEAKGDGNGFREG